MNYIGDFPTGATIYVPFATYASTGASVTITGLAVTDIEIYKDGGTTQRSSDAGYTLLDTDGIDFDGITGIHGFSIDTSDNTDAGFYAAGHEYWVVVSSITADSQTVNFVAATFSIERSGGALALLKNATYGLSALETLVDDVESTVNHADYGNAKLVRSTTPANTLTVDASHQALSLTNAVTNDAITAAAIANGAIDAATFAAGAIDAAAIADNAIDNGALAADAITAAKIAADVTTELQAGLATATAALILATPANKLTTDASGRVEVSGTKNTLDDLNDAAAAPSAADIKTALEADGSKLDHLWEMTEDDGGVRRLTANALEEAPVDGAAPTVGDIADAVWDEALAGHAGLGTAGATLSAASAPTAADVADAVWDEALAGHAGAGTAGKSLADVLVDTAEIGVAGAGLTNINLPDQTMNITGNLSGSVGSVTGAVGSVTGAVGSVTGAVGSVTGAVGSIAAGGITAASIATGAIDADSLAADAGAEIADAVWDEAIAGHLGAGTTGASLNAAGAAGDPWLTALPGAYADGTAGDIIGNLVDDIGALTPAVAISTTTAASVSTGALAVRTHHSLSQAISSTYAGNLSAATKLWLAVKAEKDDTDAQAVIFIEATAGLTYLAGAAYTTVAHGSLTVGGVAGAWTITVAIDEVATGLLTAYADGMLWAECKALVGGSTVAVWDGVCDVARGIVNATS